MKSKITADERIKRVMPLPDHLLFELLDGRLLAVPLDWYPRLKSASPELLTRWEIRGGGFVVRWPELDEDLEISGLLAGNPAPELRPASKIDAATIREYRESSGISQAELAEQLGVRQATISDWEKGKTGPSPLALTRLRDLVRKQELGTQFNAASWANTSMRVSRVAGPSRRPEPYLPSGSGIVAWVMEMLPQRSATEVGSGGEYRFTDLDVMLSAPQRQDLLSCSLFNPPRLIAHTFNLQGVR